MLIFSSSNAIKIAALFKKAAYKSQLFTKTPAKLPAKFE